MEHGTDVVKKFLWLKAYFFYELEPELVKKIPGAGAGSAIPVCLALDIFFTTSCWKSRVWLPVV